MASETKQRGARCSPVVLTVKQVMSELGMSKNAVYAALATKQIPSIRIGSKILIPRAQFERMLGREPDEAA